MVNRKQNLFLVLVIISLLSVSFISASAFGDFWGKITGNSIRFPTTGSNYCVDFDGNSNYPTGKNYYTSAYAVRMRGGGEVSRQYDACVGNVLWEAYCGTSGYIQTDKHDCSVEGKICSGKKCIVSSSGVGGTTPVVNTNPTVVSCPTGFVFSSSYNQCVKCVDSDIGVNSYTTAGYAKIVSANGYFLTQQNDSCSTGGFSLGEKLCSSSGDITGFNFDCRTINKVCKKDASNRGYCDDSNSGGTPGTPGTVTPTCSDSDASLADPHSLAGMITGSFTDGTIFSYSDKCVVGSTNVLREFICRQNTPSSETFTCVNGCSAGACVSSTPIANDCPSDTCAQNLFVCSAQISNTPGCSGCAQTFIGTNCATPGTSCQFYSGLWVCRPTPVSDSCSSTDDSNFDVYGVATGSRDGVTFSAPDYCVDNEVLNETFCTNGLLDSEIYDCLANDGLTCFDNACIDETLLACESDDYCIETFGDTFACNLETGLCEEQTPVDSEECTVETVAEDCPTVTESFCNSENQICTTSQEYTCEAGVCTEVNGGGGGCLTPCPNGCTETTSGPSCTSIDGRTACSPEVEGNPSIQPRTRLRLADGTLGYCDPITLEYLPMVADGLACISDYECTSNSCLGGVCTSIREELNKQSGILTKIWCFMTFLTEYTSNCDGLTDNGYCQCIQPPVSGA